MDWQIWSVVFFGIALILMFTYLMRRLYKSTHKTYSLKAKYGKPPKDVQTRLIQ